MRTAVKDLIKDGINRSVEYLHDPSNRRKILLSTVLVTGIFTAGLIIGHSTATSHSRNSTEEEDTPPSPSKPKNTTESQEKNAQTTTVTSTQSLTPGEQLQRDIREELEELETNTAPQLLQTLIIAKSGIEPTTVPNNSSNVPSIPNANDINKKASENSSGSSNSEEHSDSAEGNDDDEQTDNPIIDPVIPATSTTTTTTMSKSIPFPVVQKAITELPIAWNNATVTTKITDISSEDNSVKVKDGNNAKEDNGTFPSANNATSNQAATKDSNGSGGMRGMLNSGLAMASNLINPSTLGAAYTKSKEMGNYLWSTGSQYVHEYIDPNDWVGNENDK